MMQRSSWGKSILLLLVIGFTSGCAALGKPEISRQARQDALARIDLIQKNNAALKPYKGIGQMWFFDSQGAWSVRGAWVGDPMGGRFRVEALGMTGQPLAKLICDDRACHFLFFENGCFRTLKSDEKSLKPLTGVAVDVDDLVLLLGGGVPVYPHDSAGMEPAQNPGEEVLVLRSRWGGLVEKLFFADGGKRVVRIETYGLLGLRYRAETDIFLPEKTGRLPELLQIVNAENAGMRVDIEREWTDAELPADVFVPKMPEELRCD